MSNLKLYKADLHIHSVLSPCGDIDMSPVRIVQESIKRGLQIIGIADHNSTRQVEIVKRVGEKQGLTVLMGVEITTKEEVHLLAFFDKVDAIEVFQAYLDLHKVKIPNKPGRFGYQVWVNEEEEILGEEPYLLITGLDVGIEHIITEVRKLNGLLIPAHVDRPRFSWMSQLGFFDSTTDVDAIEVSRNVNMYELLNEHPELEEMNFIASSDAHLPEQIGIAYSELQMKNSSFEEIRKALRGEEGRKIINIVNKK